MFRGIAALACLMGAACTTLWGIDELEFRPSQQAGVGGGAATANGGSDSVGGMSSTGGSPSTGGTNSNGGGPPMPPSLDCLDALQSGAMSDGVYTIDLDGELGPMDPMQVYCDMTTAGGGWTLMWAYTFTDYDNFDTDSNAVTPRPSWPLNVGDSVPVSTTTPLSLTDYNAMEFTRWADFGSEFLVVSNITHWMRCTPDSGSLVDNASGLVDCEVVMTVAPFCVATTPNLFISTTDGSCVPALALGKGGLVFCWDGRTNNHWPTHDPCGFNQPNHLQNVIDPRGAIFVRRLAP